MLYYQVYYIRSIIIYAWTRVHVKMAGAGERVWVTIITAQFGHLQVLHHAYAIHELCRVVPWYNVLPTSISRPIPQSETENTIS